MTAQTITYLHSYFRHAIYPGMIFSDKTTIGELKQTDEGYVVSFARFARTGLQDYAGWEMGRPDLQNVTVYRAPEEVFSKDSIRSLAGVAVTVDHPDEMVTADNWDSYAVGEVGEEVLRDGEFLRSNITIRAKRAIDAVKSKTKVQLSAGYEADIIWGDGVTPDGLPYHAKQSNIKFNHVSIVGAARGGDKLTIGDENMSLKSVIVDGHTVEVTDAAAIAIAGLEKKLVDAVAVSDGIAAKDAKIGELTASVSAKDGEIAALKQQLEDAKITPAKVNEMVAERAKLIDGIKKIIPAFDGGDKTVEEIRKEVVLAKLGDAAKEFNDEAIKGAFGALLAGVTGNTNHLSDALNRVTAPQKIDDGYQKSITNLNAWRTA